jgi:hypothetical protein
MLERVAAHGFGDTTRLASILNAATSNPAFKIDADTTTQLNCLLPMITTPDEFEYPACSIFPAAICVHVQEELDKRCIHIASALLQQFGVPVYHEDESKNNDHTDGVTIIDMNIKEAVIDDDSEDVDEVNQAVDHEEQKHDLLLQTVNCPITLELMQDPVFDSDGNSYERVAILKHLAINATSPMSRRPLTAASLRPNRALKDMIQQLLATGFLETVVW